MLQLIYQLIIYLGAEKEMKKITLQHVLGNKILEYDVDDRGVIIDEREKDRYAKQQDSKEKLMSNWIKEHIVFYYDVKKQGATNETLKESAYLQDLSGKGRRMKLNNFLFDMMSGIGKDNSLVTDGVDDYGLVENLSSGVKMLFMTVNPIGDFNISKMYYSQRKDPIKFSPLYIFTGGGSSIAYPGNQDGVTYINGVLNKSIKVNELFGVKHIITTVNANVKPETSKAPSFFWEEGNTKNYCSKLAFYNSIAFDSIPSESDGFTEQELIDYVIDKYELK